MKPRRNRNRRRKGYTTFQFLLVLCIVILGIVGGVGLVRCSLLGEYGDLVECICKLRIGV